MRSSRWLAVLALALAACANEGRIEEPPIDNTALGDGGAPLDEEIEDEGEDDLGTTGLAATASPYRCMARIAPGQPRTREVVCNRTTPAGPNQPRQLIIGANADTGAVYGQVTMNNETLRCTAQQSALRVMGAAGVGITFHEPRCRQAMGNRPIVGSFFPDAATMHVPPTGGEPPIAISFAREDSTPEQGVLSSRVERLANAHRAVRDGSRVYQNRETLMNLRVSEPAACQGDIVVGLMALGTGALISAGTAIVAGAVVTTTTVATGAVGTGIGALSETAANLGWNPSCQLVGGGPGDYCVPMVDVTRTCAADARGLMAPTVSRYYLRVQGAPTTPSFIQYGRSYACYQNLTGGSGRCWPNRGFWRAPRSLPAYEAFNVACENWQHEFPDWHRPPFPAPETDITINGITYPGTAGVPIISTPQGGVWRSEFGNGHWVTDTTEAPGGAQDILGRRVQRRSITAEWFPCTGIVGVDANGQPVLNGQPVRDAEYLGN